MQKAMIASEQKSMHKIVNMQLQVPLFVVGAKQYSNYCTILLKASHLEIDQKNKFSNSDG